MRAVLLALILLVVFAAGVAIGLAGRAANVALDLPFLRRGAVPTPAATRASEATPAAARPAAAPAARADPARGEVAVEVAEGELAAQLNARLAGRPLTSTPVEATAERFTVALRNGQMEVGGHGRVGPTSVPFTVTSQVTPDGNGRTVVRVVDARVSGAPMPEGARGRIEQALQAEVDRQLARRPVRVRSVEIGGGRMRVIGAPTG